MRPLSLNDYAQKYFIITLAWWISTASCLLVLLKYLVKDIMDMAYFCFLFPNSSDVPFICPPVLYYLMKFWKPIQDVLMWKLPKMERLTELVLSQPHWGSSALELWCNDSSHPSLSFIFSLWRRIFYSAPASRPAPHSVSATLMSRCLMPFSYLFQIITLTTEKWQHAYFSVLNCLLFFFWTSSLEIRFCYLGLFLVHD